MAIKIFDTTLRDGEQSPGVSLSVKEKLEIAKQLAKLEVDVIEAGFPIASEGDFKGVQKIAQEVKGPVIAGLARATKQDIDRAGEALKDAKKPRIHTFIATSPVHMKYKLKKSPQEVLESAVEAVKYAKTYTNDVEFSAEDAFRSDKDFLCEVFEAVIAAGATTINVPDTVGYATPLEFGGLIKYIKDNVPNINQAVISVHCHNDLGLAVANSLAAIENGAKQVECAVNGIGERAGNTALEEIALALNTRYDYFAKQSNLNLKEIARTSRLVSHLTGMEIQPNKAIVGKNAFAHESGIHQDGVIKERTTYEIMDATTIGLEENKIVLGKHSGRHAFRQKLEELGYELSQEELNSAFKRFKNLADKKKEITGFDLEAIMEDEISQVDEVYQINLLQVTSSPGLATATVQMEKDTKKINESACSEGGPIDAIYEAMNRITGLKCKLADYQIDSVTSGKDALGEVIVKLEHQDKIYVGRGISTDIIEASARAYNNAMNRILNTVTSDK
ncbi:2-isopropylmalate synthase [Orenia metallireducens]|uniref:2-isopropylmalate synthase n=1 Tax=Orenia metallireducens TaxID=1413210 RepID=A0A285H9W0_9FIRM|nr:2-isopropylmalate synthase [Orenia metallireducens]PRX21140.1 2-isopropylmalate synthase [Orenia metallireducens]SNY31636.1 2-isopropylmalate synthase [Orenia metallireducens]